MSHNLTYRQEENPTLTMDSESFMYILNFSHPITQNQHAQIEALTGRAITRTLSLMPHFDDKQPFVPQVVALLAQIDLTPAQWQGAPILVMLPSLNFIAAALLAELHGRMGYFPPVIRTRPVEGAIPRQFEVAEILDLQTIRDVARRQRDVTTNSS